MGLLAIGGLIGGTISFPENLHLLIIGIVVTVIFLVMVPIAHRMRKSDVTEIRFTYTKILIPNPYKSRFTEIEVSEVKGIQFAYTSDPSFPIVILIPLFDGRKFQLDADFFDSRDEFLSCFGVLVLIHELSS